jgi:cytoskeletal protein CcmA (bactofilin family)
MKKRKRPAAVTTFLGADAAVEGTLSFKGTVRLDGRVNGRIEGPGGTVIVGERAVIDADIDVDVAVVMGRVNGCIQARDRIDVLAPGTVNGDIYAPTISIDSGATFNGNCGTKAPRPPAPAERFAPGEPPPAPAPGSEEIPENN